MMISVMENNKAEEGGQEAVRVGMDAFILYRIVRQDHPDKRTSSCDMYEVREGTM